MADFVRFGTDGREMKITCQRVEGKKEWEIRILMDGQKDYIAVERSSDPIRGISLRKRPDTPEGAATLVVGLKRIELSPETAKAFKDWLAEAVEASKTDEEKAEEAEASKRKEIERIEALLERAKGQQPRTPKTKKEASELTQDLREFQREEHGEWGGWARIISEEEVEELTARLAELKGKA